MPISPLSLPAFKSWLASSPNLVVGQAQLFCNCPLANFLRSPSGAGLNDPVVTTTAFSYILENKRKRNLLPRWALAFIENIDNLDYPFIARSLTGAFCLSILSDLPEVTALESSQ